MSDSPKLAKEASTLPRPRRLPARFGQRQRGLSLIELVLAVAVLTVIASIGLKVAGSVTAFTSNAKLKTDVGTLNRAVTLYLASGGDLSQAKTPVNVLDRLKTVSSAARAKTQINPLTQSMVDRRLSVLMQSDDEARSDRLRAYWNTTAQRFVLGTKRGPVGVKAFVLDDRAAPAKPRVESRASGSMDFASKSGWIWDYKDSWDSNAPGPTGIPTSIPVSPVTPPTPVGSTRLPSGLEPPVFSIASGNFPATDFDLSLTLSNPNPRGVSHIAYSLGDGRWQTYHGALTVQPGTEVIARAISEDAARYYDSRVRRENYNANLIHLDPPKLLLSEAAFSNEVSNITVDIADLNAEGLSNIYYDIKPRNGSFRPVQLWDRYDGRFAASVNDYPEGFDVIAYAKAVDPDRYEHSGDTEGATTATFFGEPLTGDVLFVIDASSSMDARFGRYSRYQAAIQETADAIWALDPSQRFNVAMFDAGVHWTDGSNELKPADQANKISMTYQIRSVDNDSGTNYKAALGMAMRYDPMPETVVFLTDGRPNRTPYAAELAALASHGIEVKVFGIELDASAQATVQAIADATGGSVTTVAVP